MKKNIAAALCAAILLLQLFALSACGDEGGGGAIDLTLPPETSSGGTISGPGVAGDGYGFVYRNINVVPHAEMGAVASALGTPTAFQESESCAFLGKDKVYIYPGITVYTYPINGVDYILQIVFTDDSVSMPEGIMLGSTSAEVIAAYGNSYQDINGSFSYEKGGTNLQLLMRDGAVYSIKLIGIFK